MFDRQVAVGVDVGALPRHPVAVGQAGTSAGDDTELRIDGKGTVHEILFRETVGENVALFGGVFQLAVDTAQQHLDRRTDDFEVTEFFGGDIHQHVVFVGIGVVATESLYEVLHGRLEFAVSAAELFEHQPCETRVGFRDPCVELEFFGMVKHSF